MNPMIRLALICFLATLVAREAAADDAPPLMAKPRKVLFEDDFARADMRPKWDVGKGIWTIKDGVITGAEDPKDHHGAYAYINPNIVYKDIIAEFSFKLDGATDIDLNVRDNTYKAAQAGHILRATIKLKQYQVVDLKLGIMKWENYRIMKDPKADPEEKKAVQAKIKDKYGNFKTDVATGAWHQARVEVVGDEILMSIDGKPVAYLKSEGIGHPTKNMLGFSVGGASASFKNPRFWEAAPNPDWEKRRAEVVGGLTK